MGRAVSSHTGKPRLIVHKRGSRIFTQWTNFDENPVLHCRCPVSALSQAEDRYQTQRRIKCHEAIVDEASEAAGGGLFGLLPDDRGNGLFCMIDRENCLGDAATRRALGVADKLDAACQAVLDSIIVVGASEKPDIKGRYLMAMESNYGQAVTIAAPGDDIISAVPGGYQSLGGTSQAAPMVAAAAALIWSMKPELSPGLVKAILVDSANEQVLDENQGRGDNPRISYPLINLLEAAKLVKSR